METFAVALVGDPAGWLLEAASAEEAIDIVHGTVPRAREVWRGVLPRTPSRRGCVSGFVDAPLTTSRTCYGGAGTGKLAAPYVQPPPDSFRRGTLRLSGPRPVRR